MAMIGLGLGLAALAAACYEVSYAIQALEARSVPARTRPRAALLVELAGRRRWLAAIALGVAGFALQIAALGAAPLTLVQPVIASGLLLLLYLGVRLLGEAVSATEIAAAVAVVAGVAGIAAAAPDRSGSVSQPLALGLVAAGLVAVALGPYLLRRSLNALLVASAGAADAAAAVAAKLVSNELGAGRLLLAVSFAAGAGATVLVGLTSETAALQRLPATRVAPLVLVVQTAVPVLLAPALLGEDWGDTALGGAVLAGSLLLLGVGAFVLARSAAVGAFEHQGGGGR